MSKFEQAISDAILLGQRFERGEVSMGVDSIEEIAQRYGPLEFTREEVRDLLSSAYCEPAYDFKSAGEVADVILSRHTEGEGDAKHSDACARQASEIKSLGLDPACVCDTPTIKASEIERITGEKVPEWAQWVAKEEDAELCVYERKPFLHEDQWDIHNSKQRFTEIGDTCGYMIDGPWQDSLRRIVHDDLEKGCRRSHPHEPTYYCDGNEGRLPEAAERRLGINDPPALNRQLLFDVHKELLALTKRLAAIEKRLLADGHARNCERINLKKVPLGSYGLPECTCGHDDIQEATK